MFKDNSIKSVHDYFEEKLIHEFTKREIQIFTELSLDTKFGISKVDLILNKQRFSESELLWFRSVVKRLLAKEPIQYILGTSHFYGLDFKVSPAVLIPRPETEELVDLIVKSKPTGVLLDIGTGSGIIPICLEKHLNDVSVHGLDVSTAALSIAAENAFANDVDVHFFECDILQEEIPLDNLDLIVSNPPYVLESDKEEMEAKVLEYEPGLALFVDDSNPLLFYKRIIKLALTHLKANGQLFFEIHEEFGQEILNLLSEFKSAEVLKDLQGKDRFIRAVK